MTFPQPATNSTTASAMVTAVNASSQADLAVLFECPVCFDYVLPPIYQCDSGHLICTICRPKLTCCPSCRGPLGSVRNLAMEKVAETVKFPCKYASSGCTLRMLHNEKRSHEEICEYRPYSCPGTAHLSGNGLAECGRAAGSGGRTGGTVGGGGGGTPLFHLSQRGGDLPSNHTGTHGKYIRTLIPQSIYPRSEAVGNEATEHCIYVANRLLST